MSARLEILVPCSLDVGTIGISTLDNGNSTVRTIELTKALTRDMYIPLRHAMNCTEHNVYNELIKTEYDSIMRVAIDANSHLDVFEMILRFAKTQTSDTRTYRQLNLTNQKTEIIRTDDSKNYDALSIDFQWKLVLVFIQLSVTILFWFRCIALLDDSFLRSKLNRTTRGRRNTSNNPFEFSTTKYFGINRNRISRGRSLAAIRENHPSWYPLREDTIEARKGHGSRNLSSVVQHCCHGCFALSQRIDGGVECCWVRSLFLDVL